MTLLDHTDLAELLAVAPEKFTQLQRDAIDAHLAHLTGSLSRELNRLLDITEVTDDITVTDPWGGAPFSQTPVVELLGYSVNGVASTLTPLPSPAAWNTMTWPFGTSVTVRYLAGIDASTDPGLRGLLLDKATPYAVTLLARDAARAGTSTQEVGGLVVPKPPAGVKQFAVEGLNVTFQSDTERQAADLDLALKRLTAVRWTKDELDSVGVSRLRRRVVA